MSIKPDQYTIRLKKCIVCQGKTTKTVSCNCSGIGLPICDNRMCERFIDDVLFRIPSSTLQYYDIQGKKRILYFVQEYINTISRDPLEDKYLYSRNQRLMVAELRIILLKIESKLKTLPPVPKFDAPCLVIDPIPESEFIYTTPRNQPIKLRGPFV